ncbi:blastoderm-specific gene 25D isoform X3 [Rhodnius prolixus]|uniref:blastoderm-specific gene 25D isoform X3 n=1 Tax=Rhodnius prolixus TaxID=13249 RepID=UPI003D18C4CD
MESLPGDPYERQLLEVFKSCDCDGKGLLNNDGLSRLCELLHLEDGREELISCLLPNGSNSSVPTISFIKFRDALLALLGGVAKNNSREPSPDREVSPKYVYGQKKYGRRSRPESIEQLDSTVSEDVSTNGDDRSKLNSLRTNSLNNVLLCSSPELIAVGDTQESDTVLNDSENDSIIINKECEDSGETELRNAWERLGVGRDGYLHPNELAMVCSAVGMDTMAEQVVAQVFSTLKTDDEGRISFEEFLELFRSRSRVASPQIVDHTSNQYTKLPHIMDLCDINGLSAARILQEYQVTKAHLEAVTEERDKLRTDLADANHRASLLAQEVDEHHAKIEKASRAEVELREQKHNEEMKELKKQMVLDKEQLLITNQKLEKSLAQQVEELSKLTSDFTALKKDYELLEKENQFLNCKLTESNLAKQEFQGQLECMEALHQRVIELESLNELSSNLKEKINILQAENTQLRDKNDELNTQLETLVTKSNQRREANLAAFDYGSGTKRRGKSPELFNETRMGKVRRCCTETDLSNSHSHQLFLRSESVDNSDIVLEDESDSFSTSPALPHGFVEQDGADWIGNNYPEDIQKMKAQIAELEARIDQYQMKEWLLKTNVRDGDSINTYLSAESTQVTSASCNTSAGGDISYCVSPNRSLIESSLTEIGVQTESPVANLERHCHELESELERVREKILSILTERRACSEENCALKLKLHLLMKHSVDNAKTDEDVSNEIATLSNHLNIHNEKNTTKLPENSFKCLESALNDQESALEKQMECLMCTTNKENNTSEVNKLREENELLAKRCGELETSLELMRIEYEKTEDYWESKLEEERRLFEMDQQQSDEKFAELEAKILEYSAELNAEESKRPMLPPIEEDFLEKQFTDLEDEFRNYKIESTKELAEKEEEIRQLKQNIEILKTSRIVDVKDEEVQTNSFETTKYASKYKHTTNSTKFTNPRLENIQIFHSLSNRLRQQEIRCRDLQSALKQQHKQTEQILQKALERHKTDLATIQTTLIVTQEKLNLQTKTTKQQLERLAMADGLVKDLVQENAHLAATVVNLEHRFQSVSNSAISNSI